ncbi:hypothetical protein LMH87_003380 [Akanthomyces muscarius]|uniref:DUF1479 domain protein n=1 Tax=Akanthomyces muscarius TaxID=2231603 RepID=A0A9W8Q1U0_AKAMU|nr:hypothetical protein LMH87_003380 [Akanthomyces muscarius]KAJ4144499.1 hypothetical protein LMH87_003380 [Akanthomyces muscarius]
MAPQPPRPSSRGVHPHEPHRRRGGVTQSPAGKAPRAPPTTAPARGSQAHDATSFWGGSEPVPLPPRFARIKRAILAGHEDALEASWGRLLAALRRDAEHIDGLGAHLVPSIEFGDVLAGGDASQTAARFRRDVQRYGVGVVRKVVPRGEAEAAMEDTARYVREQGCESAEAIDPACRNLFWSPAQVAMRAHPNVRKAQSFMMGLWDEGEDEGEISTQHPIAYADRIRVYGGGSGSRSTDDAAQHPESEQHPPPNGSRDASSREQQQQQPPSPEDWITALQSSAGITAQVDNGSLERWEPDGYSGGGGIYASIFAGGWERHDPWRGAARRAAATTDLYNGHGACSVLRMFQGVLALSVVEPGMIRLLPSPRAATAYYLLRPFFAPLRSLPGDMDATMTAEEREEAWERHMAPSNWRLARDPDTVMHGAVPGHAQRVTERWHPHLALRRSMITLPTLQAGDYILWHPDLPYHISPSDGSSSSSSVAPPPLPDRSLRMLVYIPAAPLTQTSALYLARQRKAFRRGQPGPDFDARNRPTERQDVAAAEALMERVGGVDALRAMGLVAWDVVTRPSRVGGDEEEEEEEEFGKASGIVRLANSILFPEMSLSG